MKAKDSFTLKEIGGITMIVPTGNDETTFSAMITVNSVGAFIWKILEQGADEEEIVKALTEHFEVDEQRAATDTAVFLEKLDNAGLIDK
ncbi:MAG: PqqD family protein [Clostridia bacterium]|nr:PqqD family protein [Clostridia bacterium]